MIIAAYKPNGATVYIADDHMAQRGSAEERRIEEEQQRVAHDILTAWVRRNEHEKTA